MDTPEIRVPGWLNALRIAVLVVGIPTLVYWAMREQALDWRRGWGAWLALGVVLAQAAFAVYALRFRTVMRVAGVVLAYRDALRIAYVAFFYQFFLPLSFGGDVAKFITLRLRAHGSVPIAGGIVFDHFIGLSALGALSAGLFVWRRPVALEAELWLATALVLALMVGAGLLVLRLQRRAAPELEGLPALVARHRLRGLAAFTISLAMQCLFATAVFVGAHAWGIDIDFLDLLFVQATALMFQAVPISVGGVGAADLAGTGLYVALGLPLPAAVLLVSLFYVYRLIAATAGGLWDLAGQRARA